MSIAVGLLLMILFGISLSAGWSLVAAILQTPVSYPTTSAIVISLAGVFAACGYVARRTSRWWKGALMSLAVVFFNWGGWIFVSSRFRFPDAISLGVFGIGANQLGWWLFAFLIGVTGSLVAVGFRLQAPRIGSVRPSSILFVANVWVVALLLSVGITQIEQHLDHRVWVFHSSENSPAALASYFGQIGGRQSQNIVGGRHMRAISKADGTQFDLFLYDLESDTKAGVYDQDQHGRNPGSNRNYTFYGFNVRRALGPVQRASDNRSGDVIAIFSGGFFDAGPRKAYQASHISSIIYGGNVHYPASTPAWTLALLNAGDKRLSLGFASSVEALPKADYGISDVQALFSDGKPISGRPLAAVDDLKISRTSIGWNSQSRLYVLVVRDPDSEADSIRQAAGGKQTGGWNVAQLRSFWQGMNVANAVNLAGGDSSQILYRRHGVQRDGKSAPEAGYQFIASSGFGVTAGYIKGRPVRLEIPTLPPHLMSRGCLNYIYLYK